MNRTKPPVEPPPPLVVGFLTATFVVGLVAATVLLLGLQNVITSPALLAGAATFVLGVLATSIRGQWWQRKQRRTTGTALGGRKIPEHIQQMALQMTLLTLALTLAFFAGIVLAATGHTPSGRDTVVMVLCVIGLAPGGFVLTMATYGYVLGKRLPEPRQRPS